TLRGNRADFERVKLRQRVLVDVSKRTLRTTIIGEPAALPIALAPIGLCGMQWGDGEILACRPAQAAKIPFWLSTMSICSIEDVNSLAQWIGGQFDPALSWKDVEWIKNLWGGKLIIKGVLDVEDAKRAAQTGAAAIVVSNHGGRQLDGAPSSISALPKVIEA